MSSTDSAVHDAAHKASVEDINAWRKAG
jgi:hypothetical protein